MYNYDQSKRFHQQVMSVSRYETPPAGAPMRLGPFEWLRAVCFHTRILWLYHVGKRMIARGEFHGGKYTEGYVNRSWKAMHVTEAVGGRIEVNGLQHLANTPGPVVIVGNHMSSLETIILPVFILPFKDVAFVVKQSLRTHFAFGPIMCAVKHIAVSRDNPREDLKRVLAEGAELIRQGVTVVIFPQATRSVEFDVEGFNTLGIKLAARAGVPVVPLALKTDFMANGKWIKDAGYVHPERPVRMEFGPPITIAGNGREAHAAVVNFIISHLTAWGGKIKGTLS